MKSAVGCDRIREAVSAELDGEPGDLPAGTIGRHLRTCLACRSWRQEVTEMTQRSRLRPATPPPDLSAAVSGAARWARPATTSRWPFERWALLLLGALQLLLSMPVLIFGEHAAGLHLSHEVGVTDVALAVGVLAAACQPWRAAGMLPVVLVLAGGLGLTSALDIAAGRVEFLHEAPHLLAVADALLLILLRRRSPVPSPGANTLGVVAEAGQRRPSRLRRTA